MSIMSNLLLLVSQVPIPGESKWLDNGVLGLVCLTLLVGLIYLFRLYIKKETKHEEEIKQLTTNHKQEMKELLYELVEAAKEQSGEYLQVAEKVTKVVDSLERRLRSSDEKGNKGE